MSGRDAYGLAGRACVVTGGGSGIGRGIAVALAREGAKVAILDRNEAGARETLGLVEAEGAQGIALACDTSDPASVEACRGAVSDVFGDADVLVNNAGVIGRGKLADIALEE
jgi:glucose 1-dehydrogenase